MQELIKQEIDEIKASIQNIEGVLLFESKTGISTGTIDLSDSIYNYKKIKIAYGNIEDMQYLELDTNDKKLTTIHLLKGYLASSTIYQMQTADLSCSGSTLTFQNNKYENIQHNSGSFVSDANFVKVFKVFGINKKQNEVT